ncbi:hypothetical protein MLD63_00500 (plasmid) [Paracoccus sp. TK19116]|uniref:Uncharacterized protein n=1 Tax=Paracoccus albicereus TaxID=2922394 RepID=A0ABT1MMT5_9RHOB|nr:hypothetical protein [Paracoccus albicereus]MCQ0968916.1 hypothetical protein [Paracoccus albicereus]
MNVLTMTGLGATLQPLTDGGMLPDLGFATITVGSRGTAQGQVLRHHRDGRVTVDAGGAQVTGHPIGGTPPRGWWGRIGSPPII